MIVDENLQENVRLFAGDMRKVSNIDGYQADILMSELLGSFGDNELSPECLLPTERFVKEDGVFFPYDYTNYVVPISSKVLWTEVKVYASQGSCGKVSQAHQLYPFELPYVCNIYNANFPCGQKTTPVFTFDHFVGKKHQLQSLKKHGSFQFVVQEEQSIIHGFAGYFQARLYRDIMYSTQPETKTQGMHSWFEMFFPVSHPMQVRKG
mmetsp:Transcript_41065/g.39575  ORF Transcript_41065/g.39575 Transcript_41065/m.39575 type:complete len:208 (+) Transcript_41065:86-709(+)